MPSSLLHDAWARGRRTWPAGGPRTGRAARRRGRRRSPGSGRPPARHYLPAFDSLLSVVLRLCSGRGQGGTRGGGGPCPDRSGGDGRFRLPPRSPSCRPGGGPHVRVFDANGNGGSGFFAYDAGFGGGVNVAVGDIDGDGRGDIVTGAGPGGGPNVRVRRLAPATTRAASSPTPPTFAGGVHVAAGDVDGDKRAEIITGAGPGGGPHVRVLDVSGNDRGGFMAYDPRFVGGVHVAAGDIDGDGRSEIVTGAGPGGGPNVRVFDSNGGLSRASWPTSRRSRRRERRGGRRRRRQPARHRHRCRPGRWPAGEGVRPAATSKSSFYAYDPGFWGGVQVAAGALGAARIVTGAGPGGGPHVRIFDVSGNHRSSFFAYDPGYGGGVNVAVGNVDGSTASSPARASSSVVRLLRSGDSGPDVSACRTSWCRSATGCRPTATSAPSCSRRCGRSKRSRACPRRRVRRRQLDCSRVGRPARPPQQRRR